MSFAELLQESIRGGNQMSLLVAAMLLASCGGGSESPAAKVEVVQGLRLQKIEMQKVTNEIEAPGSVIAVSTAQVAARTMGTVMQVAAREGDTVKRGQLLAQLDERELAARRNAAGAASQAAEAGVGQAAKSVESAEAQATVAQRTYERYVYLKEQKSVSPQEFDEISAKQQAAQANLERAKAGLRQAQAGTAQAQSEMRAAESVASYARVVAPFDGRILRRTVEPGSMVAPGMVLFVVEDTSRYQLEVTLPSEGLSLVRKGDAVRVQLEGFSDKSLVGKVAEIEAGADPASHTVKARIDLPKEAKVESGRFGRGFFANGGKQALVVPQDAVVTRGQLRGGYVVDAGGLVQWRVITLGNPLGTGVEVLSGLNEGDQIVLNPGSKELSGKKASGVTGVDEGNHS